MSQKHQFDAAISVKKAESYYYYLLQTLFSFEKYETNNDDVEVQRRNLEPI